MNGEKNKQFVIEWTLPSGKVKRVVCDGFILGSYCNGSNGEFDVVVDGIIPHADKCFGQKLFYMVDAILQCHDKEHLVQKVKKCSQARFQRLLVETIRAGLKDNNYGDEEAGGATGKGTCDHEIH